MRRTDRKGQENGYMTVEASLIMPLVFLVILFIIYVGFYQHDRCVMEQAAYRAALRGSSLYGADKDEKYRAVEDTLRELTENGLVVMEETHEIQIKEQITILSEGNLRIPLSGLVELTGSGEWSAEKKTESRLSDPVFFIRLCRKLELGEKKEGSEEEEK